MTKISPSLLSANFANLEKELLYLEPHISMLHLDVMDGHFVPNLTFGPCLISALRPYSKAIFDAHLMIQNPHLYINDYAKAGCDWITIHYETTPHPKRILNHIRNLGKKAGIALNPATHESVLDYLLDSLDLILVMTVNPGFGGQLFDFSQLEKIKNIKHKIQDLPILLSVDGGINLQTAPKIACADIAVIGSALFSDGPPYENRINAFKDALHPML